MIFTEWAKKTDRFSHRWHLSAVLGLMLVLMLAACAPLGQGSPTASPAAATPLSTSITTDSSTPLPTAPPDLPVKVISQQVSADMQGGLHVLGEISNDSGEAAGSIQLTLRVLDASGATLLRTDAGEPLAEAALAPLIPDIAPGQTAPFDFALPPGIAAPASVQVFVNAYQPSTTDLQGLQVENTQVMTGPDGQAVLVGELVNLNTAAVAVQSGAALLADAGNLPVSAVSVESGVFPALLLAAGDVNQQDRAPFKIPFYTSLPQDGTWQVYTDAVPGSTVDTTQFAIDQASLFYVDARGGAHLVSSIKNNSERAFSVQILAGLFSSTGSVMDVDLLPLPVDLQPGQELPFDAAGFTLLDRRADQLAKLDHYTIQVDPARTQPSLTVWQTLAVENQQAVQGDQNVWTFSGSVTNTTGADVDRFVVIAVLKSHSTGSLAATASALLVNPAGKLAPGMRMDYSFEVLGDPNETVTLDPSVIAVAGSG